MTQKRVDPEATIDAAVVRARAELIELEAEHLREAVETRDKLVAALDKAERDGRSDLTEHYATLVDLESHIAELEAKQKVAAG